MKYVYLLQSVPEPDRHYTGLASDVPTRLREHNSGKVLHTNKYKPWNLKTFVAFTDDKRAVEFEKYLKSGSGRAFAKKRL